MKKGYLNSMIARPGAGGEVVAIMTAASADLAVAGCRLYVVGTATGDPDSVRVFEVWESAEHHEASLQLPSVAAAIAQARPLLTGEFDSQQFDVVGGLGV